MEEWNKIFKINQELDEIFMQKYGVNDKEYYEKNCIELLIEIAELVNETKCFKYWTIKKPDKDKVLEQYADTITMCLSFFTTFNIELNNIPMHFNTDNILLLVSELFKDSACMLEKGNEDLIKKIFSNLVYLGDLLGYPKEELYQACYKKMRIIENRLNSDY